MEYFDIVDENGEPTGQTIERKEAHRVGALHRTSHVWIFRRKEGELQVLLQERCKKKDSFPGCYDISSAGHIPAGFDYVESAIRELEEELGLVVKPEELEDCGMKRLTIHDVFYDHEFHDDQISKIFILWKDVEISDLKLQEEEIDGAIWMKFTDCMEAVASGCYRGKVFPNCIDMEELELLKEHIG